MKDMFSNCKTINLSAEMFQQRYLLKMHRPDCRLGNVSFETYLDHASTDMVLSMRAKIFCGRPQKETHEVKYPTTWWDAWKLAHPKWSRWFNPVQYTTVKVEWTGKVAFPELEAAGNHTTIVMWDPPSLILG